MSTVAAPPDVGPLITALEDRILGRRHSLGAAWYRRLVEMGAGGGPVTMESAADELGMAPRTLSRHLAIAGYPSPRRAIDWGRLLAAMELYRDPDVSLAVAAHALGADQSTLSVQFERLTDIQAGQWKRDGADMGQLLDAMIVTWRVS